MQRVVSLLLVMFVVAAGMAAEPSMVPSSDSVTNAPSSGRRPLVVLKQVAIRGRVFLIQENDSQLLREGIHVQVMERKEEKTIFATHTDKEGVFVLPSLDVGSYRLKAGSLVVELLVEEPEDAPGKIRLPKTILIFMPEEMRGRDRDSDHKGK